MSEAGIPDASTSETSTPREAGPPIPEGYDGGLGLGLVDVPDTPCAPRAGGLAVVLPAATEPGQKSPSLRNLRPVGARLVADIADGTGFAVFDTNGANAKVVASALTSGASVVLDSRVVHAGNNEPSFEIDVQPYDATGTPAGAAVDLADEDPEGLAGGVDGNAALFAWADNFTHAIRARGFAGNAPAGTGFYELAKKAIVGSPTMAVAPVKDGLFAVVFSGEAQTVSQTAFGRGTTTARIGDPTVLFDGPVRRKVVALARTPVGFALLVTALDSAKSYAMLVLMDVGGRRTSAGLKLVGTFEGAALAVNGNEIGILAQRRPESGSGDTLVEFRPFDLAGAPLGPWVCLDQPGPEVDRGGGLAVDGAGYSAVFRAKDRSISLAKFPHLGTGGP